MLHTGSNAITYRTGLAGVGRVRKLNPDTGTLGLIGDKGLQLCPRPAMEARPHSLSGLDPLTNVGQVFHGDGVAFVSCCFRNNGLAYHVVDMFDVSGFAAGDFTEQLPSALRAVALKPFSEGKELVAFVPDFTTTKKLPGADCGDVVFAKIHTSNNAGASHGDFGEIKNQVKVEPAIAGDQFRFPGDACVKKVSLELSKFDRDGYPALGGEQGYGVAFDRVGALVKVNGVGWFEDNGGPLALFKDRVVGQQGFVGLSYSCNGIAGHLGAESGDCLPDVVVSQVVKLDAVGASALQGKDHQGVARTGELPLQQRQSFVLLGRSRQFDADGALHLTPSLDVLGSLYVALDRLGADVAGGADVVGWGPEVVAPQGLLQIGKRHKELSGRGAFQHFYGVGYCIRRRNRKKQVDVVRLDLKRKNVPSVISANFPKHTLKGDGYFTRQDRLAVLGAPHHMVGCLVDTIPAVNSLNHSRIVLKNGCYVNNMRFLPRFKSGVSARRSL